MYFALKNKKEFPKILKHFLRFGHIVCNLTFLSKEEKGELCGIRDAFGDKSTQGQGAPSGGETKLIHNI